MVLLRGIEVVALTTDGLPSGKGGAVTAKVGPRPILVPGDPSGAHGVIGVEVVELAVDGLLPFERVVGVAEVVGLARHRLPPLHSHTIAVEERFGAVAIPSDQSRVH